MADGASNKTLSHETAEALLEAIKELAPKVSTAEKLEHLGLAYAAVVGAMPPPASRPARVVSAR